MELEQAIERLTKLSNAKVDDLGSYTLTLNNFKGLQQDIKVVLDYTKSIK